MVVANKAAMSCGRAVLPSAVVSTGISEATGKRRAADASRLRTPVRRDPVGQRRALQRGAIEVRVGGAGGRAIDEVPGAQGLGVSKRVVVRGVFSALGSLGVPMQTACDQREGRANDRAEDRHDTRKRPLPHPRRWGPPMPLNGGCEESSLVTTSFAHGGLLPRKRGAVADFSRDPLKFLRRLGS